MIRDGTKSLQETVSDLLDKNRPLTADR